MRKLVIGRITRLFGLTVLTVGLAGCSPAVQPPTNGTNAKGTPVAESAWSTLLDSAQKGETYNEYMIKMKVDLIQGSLHSSYSVYGRLNQPDRALLSINESNTSVQYYQQGQSAYYYDNGHWTHSQTVTNLHVYQSYVQLIKSAQQQGITLKRLPDEYIVDEYCTVYQATLPAAVGNSLPILGQHLKHAQMGDVQYTFYVGKRSKTLRQVVTSSVGGIHNVGSMQVKSTAIMFDLGNHLAQVQLPKSLSRQLENATS